MNWSDILPGHDKNLLESIFQLLNSCFVNLIELWFQWQMKGNITTGDLESRWRNCVKKTGALTRTSSQAEGFRYTTLLINDPNFFWYFDHFKSSRSLTVNGSTTDCNSPMKIDRQFTMVYEKRSVSKTLG